ncbi:ferric transporter subunit [Escherichia coli]|nr:ferric transporter subunit [Escherichia coli]
MKPHSSLRAGSLRTITHILLPLLRPAILSALIYSFVRAITTVSAIVFLVTPDTPRSDGLHPQPRGRWRIRCSDCLRFHSDRGDAGDYFHL